MTTIIPYSQRPDWADIQPSSLDEGPAPFAPILFSDSYKDAMAYYITVAKSGELSSRVFDLTTDLVNLNSALYSVWHTRQCILNELNGDLKAEISLLNDMMLDSPKNYQLWQHRQFVINKLQSPCGEFDFIQLIADDDPKNYHMWNYRQWLVVTFGAWDNELSFVEQLLTDDVRNNSAWTYRYFLLYGRLEIVGNKLMEDMDQEIQYVISAIRRAPSNESPWIYLRGILRQEKMTAPESILNLCKTLVEGQSLSPHLFSFLVDEYSEHSDQLHDAVQTCLHLEEVVDKPRARYWAYRRQQLELRVENK